MFVPEALKRLGIKQLYPVKEQMVIDGNFPTVESPNPENPEGFYLAELAKSVGSDLIIGTDPDSDRIGTMVRDGDKYVAITGNQLGVLLLDYIITARTETGTMPANPGTVASIVTTGMARVIAEKNTSILRTPLPASVHGRAHSRLGGGRTYKYIFAFEESYGYMTGDYVRDKDAVTAAMLVAEMAAHHHVKGMTLLDAVNALYEKYGWFMEKTINLVMPGVDGLEKMQALMASLRSAPPEEIAGEEVIRLRDYLDGSIAVAGLGKVDKTPFVGSNVLYFELPTAAALLSAPPGQSRRSRLICSSAAATEEDRRRRMDKYMASRTSSVNEKAARAVFDLCQDRRDDLAAATP